MVYGVAGIERYYTFKGIPASPRYRSAVESCVWLDGLLGIGYYIYIPSKPPFEKGRL